MRSWILFFLLSVLFNCLQTKKSGFDLKQGGISGIFLFGVSSGLIDLCPTCDRTAPTVTVTNLKTKGTVETGILMGTAADNVAVSKVEIQLNTGTFQTATGTTSWTYKLPVTGWTGGNTNTINIKVTDTSGNVGTASLSTLTKGLNKDVNGDGYADLVMSAPDFNTNQGKLYVFPGSANGITTTAAGSAAKMFTGTNSQKLGTLISMGDYNGDGYSDLAACEWSGVSAANSLYVYYGSSTGLSNATLLATHPNSNNYFCLYSMTSGDFNGDGYSDLVVANVDGSNHYIKIFSGSSNGLILGQTIAGGVGSNLGIRMAAGDINGDGFTDLTLIDTSTPYIKVYLGSASGLTLSTTYAPVVTANAITMGDYNGDGKSDLIVQCSGCGTSSLLVFSSNGSTIDFTSFKTITIESGLSGTLSAVLSADINQDGITDLIAGNSTGNFPGTGQGRVYIVYGTSGTVLGCSGTCDISTLASAKISGTAANQAFGSAINVLDTNTDGFKDLVIGANTYNSSQGAVFLFQGTSSNFGTSLTSMSQANTSIIGEAGTSKFGTLGY